jgi:hypothetical protein
LYVDSYCAIDMPPNTRFGAVFGLVWCCPVPML